MAAGHKDSGKTPDRHLTEQEVIFITVIDYLLIHLVCFQWVPT
jgi:hypothetical protein